MTYPQPLHSRSPHQCLLCFALMGSMISLFAFSPIALAGYRPPSGSRPTSPTGSTATRGGCSNEPIPLTALAPSSHIGQTSATHPTFTWYVPDQQSYPMELTLVESGSTRRGKPMQTIPIPKSSRGIMQYALDKAQPGLMVGKTYRWQIAMLCNPNRPSGDVWAEATVQVVALPTELRTALAKTSDRRQRADLYANAGFWYDALTEILPDPTLKAGLLSLLEDLVKLETPEQSKQLQQVIAIEQQRKPLP